MHKTTLRELSKFASGLIAADFFVGLWLYFSGLLPLSFFGLIVTPHRAIIGMAFDVILFAFLVHYGWKMQDRSRTSGERRFHQSAGTIFILVALLHLCRIIFGWQMNLGGWEVPYWLNGLGIIVTTFLAYTSFSLTG